MPIDFPNSPTSGDTYTVGTKTWQYDGTVWKVVLGTPVIPNDAVTAEKLDAGTATDGYFLQAETSAASGMVWASIPTINALNDIGDVTAPTPTSGDFLQWNGTAWVNAVASTDVMTSTKNAAIITMDIGA